MSETSNQTFEQKNPKPVRKRRKWFIAGGVIGVLLVLVAIVIAALPSMITGGFLRGTMLGIADDAVQGQITWDKVVVKWGKGQQIEGLVVADAQGNAIVKMAKVDAPDVSLWSILWGNKNLGTITAVLQSADITQQADGQYNLAAALEPVPSTKPASPKKQSSSKTSEPLDGWKAVVNFQGSDIHVTPLDAPSVTVKSINFSGDLQDPSASIAILFDTVIEQNQQAAGQAQGTLMLKNLMDAQGNIQLGKASVDAQLSLNALPWSLLAAVANQNASYGAIVGDKISAQVKLQGRLLAPKGHVLVNSSQMKTDIKLASGDDGFVIEPGSSFALTVDARGWEVWAGSSETKLQQPVQVLAQIKELSLPRKAGAASDEVMSFDLKMLKAAIDLSVSDVKLQGPESVGLLALTGTKATLRSEQLGKKITLTFDADASRNNATGKLQLLATATDLADANGELGLSRVNADVQASASRLPLAVLDQVLGLGNKLAGMLGPELDAKATATIMPGDGISQASGPFEITMSSSHFKVQLAGNLTPKSLDVNKTSSVSLTLTPEGAVAVGLPADILLAPVPIRFEISEATIPRNEQGLVLDQGRFNAKLSAPLIALAGMGEVKQLGVDGLLVTMNSQAIGKQITVDAQATAKADAQRGSFTASMRIDNLLAASGQTPAQDQTLKPMSVMFEMATKELPLSVVDALAGQKDVMTTWLGPTLNVQAKGQMQRAADAALQGNMALAVDAKQLKVDTKASIKNGVLQVDPTSNIKLTLADEALTSEGVTLDQPLVLTVTLGDISVPVSPVNLEAVKIQKLAIHTTPVRLTGELGKTGYGLSAMDGQVVALALGDRLTVNLQGKAQRNGTADSPIVITADVLKPLGNTMQVKANITLSNVAVAVIDAIAKQEGLLLAVLGPELTSMNVSIETAKVDAPADKQTDAKVAGQTQAAAPLLFEASTRSTNLNMPSVKGLLISGQAVVLTKSQPITLRVTREGYERLMRPPAEAETQGAGNAVTNALKSKKGSSIKKLLGAILPQASAAGNAKASKNEPFILDGAIDVKLMIEQGRLSLAEVDEAKTPAAVKVKTPAAVKADGVDAKGVDMNAEPFDLHRVSAVATVEVPQLAYRRESDGQRVSMSELKTSLQAPRSVGDEVVITITGKTLVTPGKQAQATKDESGKSDAATEIPAEDGTPVIDPTQPVAGQINAKIQLQKLAMLPAGGVDFYHMVSHWDVDVKKMPSQILDELASQQGKLTGMLGGAADLFLKGDMPGNLDVKLHAPLASVDGLLQITPERVIYLRDDMKVQMVATPESVAVMGLLNPQLLALESTRAPIKLVVEKKGFELPLPSPGESVDVTKIMSNINLELGQVKLRKEGMVKDVFEVLAGFSSLLKPAQVMDVEFTPLDVSMKNGQVTTNDMWLISSDLMMGTQASIDMTRTPAFATIYLGISGQTLRKLPGARSNIPADEVVDIKLSAPLSEIKVDHTLLIAQLTPLFVSAYGGKDAQKILTGVNQGISILEKLAGQKSSSVSSVTWLNHPKAKEQPAGEATKVPDGSPTGKDSKDAVPAAQPAATQPAEAPAEPPAAEPDLESSVRSLIDLFKKDKKKDQKK